MSAATKSPTVAKPSIKKSPDALPKAIFAVDVGSHQLLRLAYDSYLAAGRLASATTKTRGDVRGGGKKPWKQKGTGRARFGSSRNPIWRGGGIVFGPNGTENYTKRLSTSAKRTAVRQALTLAANAAQITTVTLPSSGKTSELVNFIAKHAPNKKRILLICDQQSPMLLRAAGNIPHTIVSRATYLNVYNILNADHLLFEPTAITAVENWLGAKE